MSLIHPELHFDVIGVASTGGLLSACFTLGHLRRDFAAVSASRAFAGLDLAGYCLDAPECLPLGAVAHQAPAGSPSYGQPRPVAREVSYY